MGQATPTDISDSLRTAITGAGLGAVVLELLRRGFDAWQRRAQLQAEQRQQASKSQADAAAQLRSYLERQMEELRSQVQRLRDEAADRERRFQEEARRSTNRIEELERRENQTNAAFVQFLTVVTMLLPDMPQHIQARVQNALDRLRQVTGIG